MYQMNDFVLSRWLVVQLTLVEYSWITAERLLYSCGTRGIVAGHRLLREQPAGFSA